MADKKFLIGLIFVLSVSMAPFARAVEQEQAPGAAGGTGDAMALLRRTADFLSQSPHFSVTIRDEFDVVQDSGQKLEFGETLNIVLQRPDHFRADAGRSDGEKGMVLFDGKDIIVFSGKDNVFAKTSRPGDLDGAVTYLLSDLKMRMPLAMMYLTRLPLEIEKRVRYADVVERSVDMDVPCVHLAAETTDVDFQIWVPSEGDPLPRRIVITYKHEDGQPQFRANFSEWNLAPNLSAALFAFSPMEGVREIPFLAQMGISEPEQAKELPKKKGGKK